MTSTVEYSGYTYLLPWLHTCLVRVRVRVRVRIRVRVRVRVRVRARALTLTLTLTLTLILTLTLTLTMGRHDLVGVLAGQPIRLLSRVLDATGSSSGSSG